MGSSDGPLQASRVIFGLARLGLLPLKSPSFSTLVILAVTAFAVLGLFRLKVDDSLSELFRTDTKEFHQYEEIDRRFPSSEYDVLVVVEGKDLLQKPQLEAFRNAVVDLQLTDGVGGLVSMLSARGKPDATGYAPPIVPDDLPEDQAAYDAVIETLKENDIVKGKFLSDDGHLALIVIALDREAVRDKSAKVIIGGIKDTVDADLKGSGLTSKLTGAPVMQLEIRNAVERDQIDLQRRRAAVWSRDCRHLLPPRFADAGRGAAAGAGGRLVARDARLDRVPAQPLPQRDDAARHGDGVCGFDADGLGDPYQVARGRHQI